MVIPNFCCFFYTVVECNRFMVSAPLMLVQPNNTFNTTATFSCETGYNLAGDAQRTCQANGTYSGVMPSCTCEL